MASRRRSMNFLLGFTASLLLLARLGPALAEGTSEPAEPQLEIVGAQNHRIEMQAPGHFFKRQITIEATSTEIKDARVSVADLALAGSPPVHPSWTVDGKPGSQPFSVPALGEVRLEITADLPTAGTYTSAITLVYGGKRRTTDLSVVRTRPALPVQITGLDKVESTSGDVWMWLSLRSTGDRKVSVHAPELSALAQEQADKSRVQARFDRMEARDESEQPVGKTFDLAPGEARRLKLLFLKLEDAGSYLGKIYLAADDMQTVEGDFTVQVKRSFWMAAGLILLGVVLSYLLRLYAAGIRPRLILRRRLLSLLDKLSAIEQDLPGGPTDDERRLLTLLRRFLQARDEDLGLGLSADTESVLTTFERKLTVLPRAFTLGRRVTVLEPDSLRPPFQQKLRQVATLLEQDSFSQQDETNAATLLTEIENGIPEEVRKKLAEQINKIRDEVKSAALASVGAKLRLTEVVEPKLQRAEALLNQGDVAAAQTMLREARAADVQILTEDLSQTLIASTLPAGYDPARWQTWKDQVQEKIEQTRREADPDRATDAYRSASVLFLSGISRAWLESVQQRRTALEANPSLSDDQKKDYGSRLNAVIEKLRSAATQAEQLQPEAAARDYATARADFDNLRSELAPRGVQMGTPGAAGSPPEAPKEAPASQAGEGVILPIPPYTAGDRPTVRELSWRLFRSDLLFILVVSLIAVLLGIKLLWAGNPVWGSGNDYLIAVLWGLGLHQISDSGFQGVSALAEKLGAAQK